MPEPERIIPKNQRQPDATKPHVLLVGSWKQAVDGDQWKGFVYEERHKGEVVHLNTSEAAHLVGCGAAVLESDATPEQKAGTARTPDFPYYSGGPFGDPTPNQVGVNPEDVPSGATAL